MSVCSFLLSRPRSRILSMRNDAPAYLRPIALSDRWSGRWGVCLPCARHADERSFHWSEHSPSNDVRGLWSARCRCRPNLWFFSDAPGSRSAGHYGKVLARSLPEHRLYAVRPIQPRFVWWRFLRPIFVRPLAVCAFLPVLLRFGFLLLLVRRAVRDIVSGCCLAG